MAANTNDPQKLYGIKTNTGFEVVTDNEMIRIEARKTNTLVFVAGGTKSIKSNECISTFRKLLPDCFVTCHRSHIVNIHHIKKLGKDCRSLSLTNNHTLKITEKYKTEVLKHFALIVKE
jgi:DNA-binding LytR/AlgR family response regulator